MNSTGSSGGAVATRWAAAKASWFDLADEEIREVKAAVERRTGDDVGVGVARGFGGGRLAGPLRARNLALASAVAARGGSRRGPGRARSRADGEAGRQAV